MVGLYATAVQPTSSHWVFWNMPSYISRRWWRRHQSCLVMVKQMTKLWKQCKVVSLVTDTGVKTAMPLASSVPLVDEEKMRPGHWFDTDAWMTGRTYSLCYWSPKVLEQVKKKNWGKVANPSLPAKQPEEGSWVSSGTGYGFSYLPTTRHWNV